MTTLHQQQSTHLVHGGRAQHHAITGAVPQYWSGPQHELPHHYCSNSPPYAYSQTKDMRHGVQQPQSVSIPVVPPYTAATRSPPPTSFLLRGSVATPVSVTPPPPSVPSAEPVEVQPPEAITSLECSPCSKSARGAGGNKVNRTEPGTDQPSPRRKNAAPRLEPQRVMVCQVVGSSCPSSSQKGGKKETKKSDDTPVTPKKTLRRQQLRLLLLRHAGNCTQDNCCVRGCAAMKALSQHIATCRNGDKCTAKHCATSRFVLGHYILCRKAGGDKHRQCQLCGPVRQAIERSKKPSTPTSTERLGLETIVEEWSSESEQ